jgi:predicted cobalt transporter CbtA
MRATRSASPATEPGVVTFSRLLLHGVKAGAAAGVAAALAMGLAVEPVIRRALVVEEARAAGHHHGEEPLVSRVAQVGVGLLTSALVGVIVGVVFAVVFAKARQRLPGAYDAPRCWVLAGGGFVTCTLLPAVTVPANPPGVGDPATVTVRSLLYLLTVLLGLLALGAAAWLDARLRRRGVSDPVRSTLGVAAAVALLGCVVLVVPASPDTVPPDVPAALLWDFRVASLTQLGAMWLVLGLVFGVLADRRGADRRGADRRGADRTATPDEVPV